MAGDYATVIDAAAAKAQRLLWTSYALFEEAEYHFYSALSQAVYWDSAPAGERQQPLEAMGAHHRQLQVWAENCPKNFKNRAALAGAEIARIEGRDFDAMGFYEEAIRSARANGFVHNEALANELAARFYAARGFDTIAHATCGKLGTAISGGEPPARCGNLRRRIRTLGRKSPCPGRRARSPRRSNISTWRP